MESIRKRYLDITSLISDDYFDSHKRVHQDTKQQEYDEFANDLYGWMKSMDLTENESEIFNIVFPSIYKDLSGYLSHVYDFYALSDKNVQIRFSEDNFYFDSIWNKKPINKIYAIELEKSRFKKSWKRLLYSNVFARVARPFFNTAVISTNDLVKKFAKSSGTPFLRLLPQYIFAINLSPTNESRALSNKVSVFLISKIEEQYFDLDVNYKKYIHFLVGGVLARVSNDLINYNGFLKGLKSVVTGTGGNYYNRLFSYLAQKEGVEVKRFDHGGDRCFFNDLSYWENELYKVDSYYTYGKLSRGCIEDMAKFFSISVNVEELSPFSFEAEKNSAKQGGSIKGTGKILYFPSSFVGEARQFPYAKIIDTILFDFQKHLIELLQESGFEVTYKQHPKGFSNGQVFMGSVADSTSTDCVNESLKGADIVICEHAGSALMEAVCANKKVILVNTGQRDFNDKNKRYFAKMVKIIDAYWECNSLNVNKKRLLDLIHES